jgi:hypothetical protein
VVAAAAGQYQPHRRSCAVPGAGCRTCPDAGDPSRPERPTVRAGNGRCPRLRGRCAGGAAVTWRHSPRCPWGEPRWPARAPGRGPGEFLRRKVAGARRLPDSYRCHSTTCGAVPAARKDRRPAPAPGADGRREHEQRRPAPPRGRHRTRRHCLRRITIPATIALAAIGLAATSGCSTSSRASAGPTVTASAAATAAAATVAAVTSPPPATASAPPPSSPAAAVPPPAPPAPPGPLPCRH